MPQKIKKIMKKLKKTTKDKTEKKRVLNANFGSDLSSPVTFGVGVRLFTREGGWGSLHPIRGSSKNIGRRMFFFLKSTFGVLFESGSASPLLLFRSPLVIVGFEFCIRTPFVLIGPGCSGTQYDPQNV